MKHVFRSGATLIELLIFLAILSMVVGLVLPLLFAATENRLLQQTIFLVEQNGSQMVDTMALDVHRAERILQPTVGETGSVLALQTGSSATKPTVIGTTSGKLIIARGSVLQTVSSSQVAVENFMVRNTSVSPTKQSVRITFSVSRAIRLQQPHIYERDFDVTFTLMPNDKPLGGSCICDVPACQGNDMYGWAICTDGICYSTSTRFDCP